MGVDQPPDPRPPRRREALVALLLGALWLALLYTPLLTPDRLLAARDVMVFHAPLRADLVRLAAGGEPFWNPWINGGQPALSNPNYAAFYPPTWLAAAVGPARSLGLGILLHAALAFAGTWLLVRRLGGGVEAAALGAVGMSGGGALVSLVNVYPAFTTFAWCPWALLGADAAFRAPPRRWALPAAGAAAAVALAFLAGDPVVALVVALCVAALAAALAVRRGPGVFARLAAVGSGTVLLCAVQLLPTAARVAGSSRAAGLSAGHALTWSMHPARLVELFFPFVWGDPSARNVGRYFGSMLQDRDLGFLFSLYPGLLLTVVGLGVLAGGVRARPAWASLAVGGTLLAFGRYLPGAPWLYEHLPGLGALRYPERFFLLALTAVVIAGALGWHQMLHRRREAPRLPLVLAAAACLAAAAAAVVVRWAPAAVEEWIALGQPARLSTQGMAAAMEFVRAETLRATLLALAVTLLLCLLRFTRVRTPVLAVMAVALLAADLRIYNAELVATVPAALIAQPPPLVSSVPPGTRMFSDDVVAPSRSLIRTSAVPGEAAATEQVTRLAPYTGNLWGVAYALNPDFDEMLTTWGRHAIPLLVEAWPEPRKAGALLGAWNCGVLVLQRSGDERQRELAAGRRSPPLDVFPNPHVLPWVRGVERVRVHRELEAAVAAVRAQGFEVARSDHWLARRAPGAPEPGEWRGAPVEIRRATTSGSRIEMRVSAPGPAFLVVATTYDRRWRARLGDRPVPLLPTALGQIGVALPAAAGELVLTYRDPWITAGAGVTGVTLLAACVLVLARRRRR